MTKSIMTPLAILYVVLLSKMEDVKTLQNSRLPGVGRDISNRNMDGNMLLIPVI